MVNTPCSDIHDTLKQDNDIETTKSMMVRMRALLYYSIRRRNQQNAADGILEMLPCEKEILHHQLRN